MKIVVKIFNEQLASLHEALNHEDNIAREDCGKRSYFVKLVDVQAEERNDHPTPAYTVTLVVAEKTPFTDNLTPMSKLARVLQAIGLFPSV